MEIVKNKVSGKYFIVLDDAGGSDFLAVTPEGRVIRLERHLFIHQASAARTRKLTKEQMQAYQEYLDE